MWPLSVAGVFSIRLAEESAIVQCRGSRDNTFFLPRWATQSHSGPRRATRRDAESRHRHTENPRSFKIVHASYLLPYPSSPLSTWTHWMFNVAISVVYMFFLWNQASKRSIQNTTSNPNVKIQNIGSGQNNFSGALSSLITALETDKGSGAWQLHWRQTRAAVLQRIQALVLLKNSWIEELCTF